MIELTKPIKDELRSLELNIQHLVKFFIEKTGEEPIIKIVNLKENGTLWVECSVNIHK